MLPMVSLIIALSLSCAAIDVEVSKLDGESATGQLVAFQGEQAVIQSGGKELTIPYEDLVAVQTDKKATTGQGQASVLITLVDGSQLTASQYAVDRSNAVITLRNGGSGETHTRSIHAVRLEPLKDEAATQWNAIIAREIKGDLIVVKKKRTVETEDDTGATNKTEVVSLDFLEGLVQNITADVVQFEFNDQVIDVNRAKLAGVVYYHPSGRELPDPVCKIDDEFSSAFMAKSLQTEADSVQLTTVAGAKLSFPLDSVTRFDFSSGKIAYLSDLEPDRADWTAFFDPGPLSENLTRWNLHRRDKNFDGGELKLHGKKYSKGLAIHSRTLLAYRLSGKYTQFLAKAGIDESVGEAGHVELVIRGDGAELFRGPISGKDEQPTELNLDVTDVRRLTILVDFGEGGDIADHLDLCDARVKK